MANQITLTFSNVTNNGLPCKDPIITILGSNNEQILFPCGDKVDKNGQIKISVPEELFSGSCINGFIKCSECGHCEEKEFEACLCNSSADCKACEKCEGGVCVSLCPDKLCENNTCVDCKGPEDCPPGFICVGGECVCNGKINQLGHCVDCFTSADCSSCEECVNGGCVPLTCPNNLICVNNGCGCPPGFVYEASTNSCVPDDECTDDTQCGECETCVSGQCQPIVCPDGYTCVGGNCVYAPCDGKPCNNGLDCANEDCGCPDDKKVCTSCLEDPNGRGCEPNGCKNTPCSAGECQEGCGCYQGECVPCSWLTPEEQANTPGCDGGGDGDCTDDFDSRVKGCNLETTLTTKEPCACPVISGALTNGKNVPVTYYQNPGSNVVSTTPARGGYINSIVAESTYKYQLRKGISDNYSGFLTLPKLDDVSNPNIAYNEMPNNGTFTLEIYGTYQTETSIGVLGAPTTVLINTYSGSIINKTEVEFKDVNIKTLEVATAPASGSNQRGLYKFLTNVKFVIKHANLVFPNSCNYGSKTVFEKSYTANTNLVDENTLAQIFDTAISVNKLKTSGDMLPLFVYKRSKTSNFTNNDVFRKVYVPKINGVYKDILYGPGCVTDKGKYPLVSPEFGFYSGYNYLITNNCGCDGAKQKLVTNAVACETLNPSVVLSLCNTKLEVGKISPNCAVNKDLSDFLSNCPYPPDAQVYFKLYVNGVLQGNLIPNETTFTKVFDSGITNVKITHSHDESCVIFEQDYPEVQKEPAYTIDCKPGNNADIVITQVVSPGVVINKVTNLGNFNEYTPANGVIRVVNVLKGSTVTLKLDFSDGCSQKMDVVVNCCGSLLLNAATNNNGKICNSIPVTVTLSTTNGFGALKYYVDNNLIPTNQSNQAIFTATTPGIYVAKVIDANDCERTINVTIGACTDITIDLTPELICIGDNSNLVIQGDPNATAILKYPSSTTVNITLDLNGKWEQAVSTDGIYEIISYNGVSMTGITAELNVVATPSLSAITADSVICEDTQTQVTFTGTPNANITVNFGFGNPVNLVIGNGGTVNHQITYLNPGSYVISVESISVNGECESTPGITKSITVLEKPIITIGQTVCDLNAGTSSTAVTVTPSSAALSITSGIGTITGTAGNFFVNADVSETLTLKASNGSCETTASLIVNCNCPDIFNPNAVNGVICANYDSSTGTYSYSISVQPSVEFNYSSLFICDLVYNGSEYPLSSGPNGTSVNIIPPSYNLNNPSLVIKAVDDNTGCEDTITINPVVNVTPIVAITGPTNICVNQPNTFNSNTTGNSAGYGYLWSVLENGTPLSVTNNTSASFTFTPTVLGATYKVTLTRSNTNGCSSISNFIQKVSQTCCPANLTVGNYIPTNSGCNNLEFYVVNGTAPFSWSYQPHVTFGGDLVGIGTGTGTNLIVDTSVEFPGAEGSYTITVTDANGCTASWENYPYQRCQCICDGTICTSPPVQGPVTSSSTGATHDLGVLLGTYAITFNVNPANAVTLRRTTGVGSPEDLLVTPLIGNSYPSGCIGTEPFVDLDSIPIGASLLLEINTNGGNYSVDPLVNLSVLKLGVSQFYIGFTVNTPARYELIVDDTSCGSSGYTFVTNACLI